MYPSEEYLQKHEIAYTRYDHPAVFTCEEADKQASQVPGISAKNLFLRNKHANRYFLIVIPTTKKADIKKLCTLLNEKKLSFASPEALMEKLQITPGSVSPLGLINDPACHVEVYIDKDFYEAENVNFHPNINTASLLLTREMFHKYLASLPHEVNVITL